jgi:hypothetical protein
VYDISGADIAPNLPVDEIENERQTLFRFVVDRSGSMDQYAREMEYFLGVQKEALGESKQEDEILMGLTLFDDNIDHSGYRLIEDFPTDYSVCGRTALYDAVIEAADGLYMGDGTGYMEVLQQQGVKTKACFFVFSDGYDNVSRAGVANAKAAIERLQNYEIIVAFVEFGPDAGGVARQLGVKGENIINTTADKHALRQLANVVSKSALSFSASAAAGQSNNAFFV